MKRKADLTTPENDNHSVKRPAIKNERTHFAITVEDIRSVKLKKTPASALRVSWIIYKLDAVFVLTFLEFPERVENRCYEPRRCIAFCENEKNQKEQLRW